MSGELIRLDGVVRRFGAVVALSGITMSVEQGEFIALLGPSGCGKTTLLRTIAGFIEPDQGEVWIDGRSMSGVPPNKRPVNTVFQHYALFPHYTVAQNIAFGPRRRGVERRSIPAMVAQSLKLVGMEGFDDRFPAQLSGGQQQRVALARAIVNRPKVLLLDEPLGALDLKLRKRMQLELKTLHRKLGISFVYVTHDQEEALVMADRVAVMSSGKVVQFAAGEEIYREPNSRYVADFIGEANLLPCVIEGGAVRLASDGHALPYRAIEPTGRTTLMVRPEDIALGPPPEALAAVTIELEIVDKVFIGNGTRVFGRASGGLDLVLHSTDRAAADRVTPGDAAVVHWAISAGRLLAS